MYRRVRIVTLLVLIILLFSSSSVFAEQNESVSEKNVVSIKRAQKAAENFIPLAEISEWKDYKAIVYVNDLHDVDDSVIAYYFNIESENRPIGYIVVSANVLVEPILEYGIVDSPEPVIPFNQGDKTYYLGALKQITAKNNVELAEKFNRIKDAKAKNLLKDGSKEEDIDFIKNAQLTPIEKSTINVTKWSEIENVGTYQSASVTATALPTTKELSVTRYYQRMSGVDHPRSACGPTSGAMIIDYLIDVLNYHNIDGSDAYVNGTAALINTLYSEMGTNLFGTSISDWRLGMLEHINNDGYWRIGVIDADDSTAANRYKTRIAASTPTTFRFDYFVDSGVTINYHFVVGVGYNHSTSSLKFGIKNPDGENNTATKWFDWAVNDQDMDMGDLWRDFS